LLRAIARPARPVPSMLSARHPPRAERRAWRRPQAVTASKAGWGAAGGRQAPLQQAAAGRPAAAPAQAPPRPSRTQAIGDAVLDSTVSGRPRGAGSPRPDPGVPRAVIASRRCWRLLQSPPRQIAPHSDEAWPRPRYHPATAAPTEWRVAATRPDGGVRSPPGSPSPQSERLAAAARQPDPRGSGWHH